MAVEITHGGERSTATGARSFYLRNGDQEHAGVAGIVRDPETWGGRALIHGTRLPVFVVVDQFEATGLPGVLEAYPELKPADVWLALAYAETERDAVKQDRATYEQEVPEHAKV